MLHAAATGQPRTSLAKQRDRLLEIVKAKSLLRGSFKLVSGATSNYYLDMKPTLCDPEGAFLVGEIVFAKLAEARIDAIGGPELGAVPILAVVCARSWPAHPLPSFIVRKEKKGHGTDKKIDGNFRDGSRVILFDDVTTKGGSVMRAVEAVRERGATVDKVITLVDRLEGAKENLAARGIALDPIFTTDDLLRT